MFSRNRRAIKLSEMFMGKKVIYYFILGVFYSFISYSNAVSNSVNLYTGQHSESFPLVELKGTGGFKANLTLAYNGNVSHLAKAENGIMQSSVFGLGFDIGIQSITLDHFGTASICDDKYYYVDGRSQTLLRHVEDSTFILETGEAWEIYRHVSDSVTDIPIIIGWTIISDDGWNYRFGDFNDSSLTNFNATRSIFRFGEKVINGVSDDEEAYPVQWDLKMIHDPDTLHWVKLKYFQEKDTVVLIDSAGDSTFSGTYTRASYIDEITLSDGRKIDIDYDDRSDFQPSFGVNICEFYSTKKAVKIKVLGRDDSTLSVIKLDYSYLNMNYDSKFRKLLLRSITRCSGDEGDTLSTTGFTYYRDTSSVSFGSIKKVIYPAGSIKEYHYTALISSVNYGNLCFLIHDTRALIPSNRWDLYTANLMFYSEIDDTARIGIWDGYWHLDTTGVSGNELLDVPALSADGWIAYYDYGLNRIITKRWRGGYWETTALDDTITCSQTDSIQIIPGKDCFLVCCGNFAQYNEEGTPTLKRLYFYHWDGNDWSKELSKNNCDSTYFLDSLKLYDGFFGVSIYNNDSDGRIYYGFYDYETGNVRYDSLLFNDFILKGEDFIVGTNYLAYQDDNQAHLYRWKDSQWNDTIFDADDGWISGAICHHSNGFSWGTFNLDSTDVCLRTINLTSTGTKLISKYFLDLNSFPDDLRLWQSDHSLVVFADGYGGDNNNVVVFEWNGIGWDSVCEYYHSPDSVWDVSLFNHSFSIVKRSESTGEYDFWNRQYLGNQTWAASDQNKTSLVAPSSAENIDLYVDDNGDWTRLLHHNTFRYSDDYMDYGVWENPKDDGHHLWAVNGGFYIRQRVTEDGYKSSAHALIGNRFSGLSPLVVVDTVYTYAHLEDSNPIIQEFIYRMGKLDISGITPQFTKVECSSPYFAGDAAIGYSVTYFYNDEGDTSISDGHIATYVTLPNFDSVYQSKPIYGIRNGGYWLDGRPYLTYAYTKGEDTTEIIDYTYYYYKLYNTPDSESVSYVYRILTDSTVARTEGMVNKTLYLYDSLNGLVNEVQELFKDGDSLTTRIKYAYEQKGDSMKNDNAISQIEERASYYYDSSGDSTTLLSKSKWHFENHGPWLSMRSYSWRNLDNQQDTLFSFRVGALDTYNNIYGVVNVAGDTSWVKYDKDSLKAIASAADCSYNEFLVQDFEQDSLGYEGWGWDNWWLKDSLYEGGRIDTTDAFTGNACYTIKDSPDAGYMCEGAWKNIDSTDLKHDLYYFSCWVKSNTNVWICCLGLTLPDCAIDTHQYIMEFTNLSDTEWKKIEGIFDLSFYDPDTLCKIRVQLAIEDVGSDTTKYAKFDNLRFHPLDARVATKVYNDTGLVSAELGLNNIPTRYEYDKFHRLTTIKNYKGNIRSRKEYYSPDVFNARKLIKVEIEHPDEGKDSICYVIGFDQFVEYDLLIDCELTSYGGDAWIYRNHGDSSQLIDSIHCADACDSLGKAGEFWGQKGDILKLYVSKGTGDSPTAEWHIHAKVWLDEVTYNPDDPAWVKTISYTSDNDSIVMASFYDSFGRLLQTRSTNYIIDDGDTTEAALVTGTAEYDARGRVIKSYKPYYDILGATDVDDFTPSDSIFIEADAYYCDTCTIDGEGRPYSETEYYDDIKGRVKEIAGPGNSTTWAIGNGHTVRYSYTSDSPNDILKATVIDPDNVVKVSIADRWGLYAQDTAYHTLKDSQQSDSTGFIVTTTYRNVKGQVESIYINDGVDSAKIREYWYNDLGRLIKEWRVDYGYIRMIYDKAGNLRFMQNDKRVADTNFVYFKYDMFGRNIEEGLCKVLINSDTVFIQDSADVHDFPGDYLADSIKSVKYKWSYDYDFDVDSSVHYGGLIKTGNADDSYYREFHYFPFKHKDSVVVKLLINNGDKKSLVHEFDELSGRMETFKFYPYENSNSTRAHQYIYDLSGNLEAIRECDLDSAFEYNRDYATYQYLPGGLLDNMHLGQYFYVDGNDTTDYCVQSRDYSYNIQGLLTAINDPDDVDTTGRGYGPDKNHFGMTIDYNDNGSGYYNGRIDSITYANSTFLGEGGRITLEYDYTYNELGWLTKASDGRLDKSFRSYKYNYLGNRKYTQKGEVEEYYMYDTLPGSSRLDTVRSFYNTTTFEYDILGNLTSVPERPIHSNDYDYRNLLTISSINQTYPGASYNSLHCNYNESGQRILKEYYYYWREWRSSHGQPEGGGRDFGTDGGSGGYWEHFYQHSEKHYLYDGNVLVADFDSTDNMQHVYINGLGGKAAVYYRNTDSLLYYFLKDQVGSARVMVNDSGDVCQYINYHPFGGILEHWTSYNEPMRFTGKEHDDYGPSEYFYFGARYYDPMIGMFSSIDKAAQFAGGYNYCGNNPIGCIDPHGLLALPVVNPTITYSEYWTPYCSSTHPFEVDWEDDLDDDWYEPFDPLGDMLEESRQQELDKLFLQVLQYNLEQLPDGMEEAIEALKQLLAEEGVTVVVISYYERALELEGTPYADGGSDSTGIDCSGLIVYATQSEKDWSTKFKWGPPGNFTLVEVRTSSFGAFVEDLRIGDILVWHPWKTKTNHAAFYAGDDVLYHAHGPEATGRTEYTGGRYGGTGLSDMYYKFGIPDVYRQIY